MLGLFYGLLVIKEPLRKLENIYDLPNQNEDLQLIISGVRDITACSLPLPFYSCSSVPIWTCLRSTIVNKT